MAIQDEIPSFEASFSRLASLFDSVPESLVHVKPKPEDWSVKEIACHLVDSASNNHQRFTRLQRTKRLTFPAYEAEPWVAVEKAQSMDWRTLVTLLKAYNAFVLHLVRNVDSACLPNVWVIDDQEKSLEFLARDYYRHLDWHFEHLQRRIAEVTAL
jgi:hypothetical protein